MPKIKYDVSNVEDMGDFKQAPKGVYIAKITEVTVGESGAGHPMLTIVLDIVKDSKGKKVKENYGRIWHRVPLTDAQPGWTFRLKEFIKALGLKEKGAIDPDKLVDELVQVSVKAGKDLDDNYRAEVGKLMALPSDEDEDDEDEDEPEDDDDEDTDADEEDDDSDEDDDDDDEDEDEDEEDDEDEDDDDESSDYSEMSKKELIAEARSREIKIKKGMEPDDIIALLEEDDAEDDDDDDDEDDEDYNEWSPEDLKAELKERGLKATGSKKVLVARLEKDDESEEDPF